MEREVGSLRQRRTLWLFVVLAVYIVLQSAWWAWLLVSKDREKEQLIAAFDLRPEAVGIGSAHPVRTLWMVAGEGLVFVVLLLAALWIVYRTVNEELRMVRRQRDLMTAVSHELRTPVAGMKLHLQALERGGLPPAEREALNRRALSDVQRLQELTERILLAARLDEGAVQLDPAVHDLRALVDRITERARDTYARDRVVQVAGAGVMALVDPAAFTSVVENLLENAVKYGPPDGAVEVELADERGHAVIRVMDRGPGVRPADRRRIFEKFQRTEESIRQQTKGTGLGLYIAGRLVSRMGGEVSVMDRPGGGAIFAATFPNR